MPIKITTFCEQTIYRKGLKLLIEKDKKFLIIDEASTVNELFVCLQKNIPNIIIINVHVIAEQIISICKNVFEKYPKIPILLFLENRIEISIPEAVIYGVRGIIWKENTEDDLITAIEKLSDGRLFFEDPDNCRLNCHISHKLRKAKNQKKQDKLTIREIEVLKLIAQGMHYKEVANLLNISSRTVETHKNNMMDKLNFKNINELIRYALINNI